MFTQLEGRDGDNTAAVGLRELLVGKGEQPGQAALTGRGGPAGRQLQETCHDTEARWAERVPE